MFRQHGLPKCIVASKCMLMATLYRENKNTNVYEVSSPHPTSLLSVCMIAHVSLVRDCIRATGNNTVRANLCQYLLTSTFRNVWVCIIARAVICPNHQGWAKTVMCEGRYGIYSEGAPTGLHAKKQHALMGCFLVWFSGHGGALTLLAYSSLLHLQNLVQRKPS